MTSCADPHNGSADEMDTYTFALCSCRELGWLNYMGIVAKRGMEV